MKTIEELKQFYDTTLSSDLQELENKRKKIARRLTVLHIICGIILAISIILFFIISFFTLIIFIPNLIIWIILGFKFTKGYKSDFKLKVIDRIIKFMDPNLTYSPLQCVSMSTYMGSKIFRRHPDRYRGDDLVMGKLGETNIMFSEVHSEYKTQSRNSNGTTTTHWHTIFKGLFFIADFNKKFKGETFVLPDVAQSMFGKVIGNLFQSWNKMRGQLIKMEDVEFEKLFVVYGSDQVEARYILSTNLMERIKNFKKKTGKQIYLSFVGNQVYVAISYTKNLFEPRLFKTLLDFNIIREYYDDLQTALIIVDELKLNTRIWG